MLVAFGTPGTPADTGTILFPEWAEEDTPLQPNQIIKHIGPLPGDNDGGIIITGTTDDPTVEPC